MNAQKTEDARKAAYPNGNQCIRQQTGPSHSAPILRRSPADWLLPIADARPRWHACRWGSGKALELELGDNETGFLEDCYEDWRALWEIPAGPPTRSIDESVGFLVPLIEGGYLTMLAVTAWEQARAAAPINRDAALTVAQRIENYSPPANEGETFYLLSITPEGEAAIPPDAFPND